MSTAATAARLIEALEARANREAEADTALVSVEISMLGPAAAGEIAAHLVRKTKTLVFLRAECAASGTLVATASSVHKISSPPA